MKKLITYVRAYLRTHFEWKSHLSVIILLSIFTGINYTIGIEPEIKQIRPSFLQTPLFFALYSFIYYSSVFCVYIFSSKPLAKLTPKFYFFSSFMLLLWSFKMGFPWDIEVSKCLTSWHSEIFVFYATFKLWVNFKGNLIFVLPALLFFYFQKDAIAPWYGIKASFKELRPYFILILLMSPILLIASFSQDFQDAYPRYRDYGEYSILGFPRWVSIAFFELAYGSGFFTIEFVMRGVFVVGAAHYLGPKAILPMAALYLSVHFGKPLAETISSFFGGYILGILTLYSRHIYGGMIVHLGIAWLMEIFAFMQGG